MRTSHRSGLVLLFVVSLSQSHCTSEENSSATQPEEAGANGTTAYDASSTPGQPTGDAGAAQTGDAAAPTATDSRDAGSTDSPSETDAAADAAAPLASSADAAADAAPASPNHADAGESCWFEYLGDWVACEESGWPNSEFVETNALQDCADRCVEDPGCTAVSDYLWLGANGGCYLHTATCDSPAKGPILEADGARHYRRVCGSQPSDSAIYDFPAVQGITVDPESNCVFKALDAAFGCAGSDDSDVDSSLEVPTLDECLQACQEDVDCTSVKDWIEESSEQTRCILQTADCAEPVAVQDHARTFRKECGANATDAGASR